MQEKVKQAEAEVPQASRQQDQVGWQAGGAGQKPVLDGKRPAEGDQAIGSGPENEGSGNKPGSATISTEEANCDGSDSLDARELENQMLWKKEKRRKQNREAQRRRRDRLMNQQRQKNAEPAGAQQSGSNGSGAAGRPYAMMHGNELLNSSSTVQIGMKEDPLLGAGGLNMFRYAGDVGLGGHMSGMHANMGMKPTPFGNVGVPGGMQAWSNHQQAALLQGNMQSSMLHPALQSFQVQHAQLTGQQPQPAQQAGGNPYPNPTRHSDSYNFGPNAHNAALMSAAGTMMGGVFWDAQMAPHLGAPGHLGHAATVPPSMASLGKQASFGADVDLFVCSISHCVQA